MIILIIGFIGGEIIIKYNFNLNKSFTIREETLFFDKLPSSFDNYKILQISDLHNKDFGKNNKDLISAIDNINPQVIMVTGDMFTATDININTDETDLVAYKLLKSLSKNYKIIYVSGNHEENVDVSLNGSLYQYRDRNSDNFYNRYLKKLKDMGVIFVDNSEYTLYKNKEYIKIYGIYYYSTQNNDYLPEVKLDKSTLNILLSHDPIEFPTFASYGFDLVLSGHVHGGVIRLPIVGGLLDPSRKLFPKYDKGIYKEGNSYMNVSAGLGDTKIHRFFNQPELNLIVLKQKQ